MSIQWIDNRALNEWLANGERGNSSDTIVMHLTGRTRPQHPSEPYDPSDFRRCEVLLRRVPLLRLSLHQMADLSPAWAELIEQWDHIVATAESEAPGCFEGQSDGGPFGRPAPQTYRLIRECRARAERTPSWATHDAEETP